MRSTPNPVPDPIHTQSPYTAPAPHASPRNPYIQTSVPSIRKVIPMDDTNAMTVSRDTLLQAVTLVAVMTDEAVVRPGPDGWTMMAMSADRVALAVVTVPSADVEGFDPAMEPFAVKVDDLLRALKTRAERVSLRMESGRLVLRLDNTTQRLPLLTVPEVPMKAVPTVEGPSAMFPVTAVRGLLEVAHPRAVEVMLSIGPEGVRMTIPDDMGVGGTEVEVPADGCVWVDAHDTRMSRYPLERLSPFVRALPRDAPVQMTLDTDYPVRVEVQVPGCHVVWVAAPRLVSE